MMKEVRLIVEVIGRRAAEPAERARDAGTLLPLGLFAAAPAAAREGRERARGRVVARLPLASSLTADSAQIIEIR